MVQSSAGTGIILPPLGAGLQQLHPGISTLIGQHVLPGTLQGQLGGIPGQIVGYLPNTAGAALQLHSQLAGNQIVTGIPSQLLATSLSQQQPQSQLLQQQQLAGSALQAIAAPIQAGQLHNPLGSLVSKNPALVQIARLGSTPLNSGVGLADVSATPSNIVHNVTGNEGLLKPAASGNWSGNNSSSEINLLSQGFTVPPGGIIPQQQQNLA